MYHRVIAYSPLLFDQRGCEIEFGTIQVSEIIDW